MASVVAGQRELAQLMTNHILVNQNWHMLPAIVHRDRQADHLREYRRTARPGLDWFAVFVLYGLIDLVHQMMINKWTFF